MAQIREVHTIYWVECAEGLMRTLGLGADQREEDGTVIVIIVIVSVMEYRTGRITASCSVTQIVN